MSGIERQTAAICVFLSFFGLGILAFEVGERYVQRFVPKADAVGWRLLTQPGSTSESPTIQEILRFPNNGHSYIWRPVRDLRSELKFFPSELCGIRRVEYGEGDASGLFQRFPV